MKVFYATGRRKNSIARVRIIPGSGKIEVNKKSLIDYFRRETLKMIIEQPLDITETGSKFDIFANVKGGGLTGQAGAVRLGISRALLKYDEELRPILKSSGFLTRDPREKERKKYGLAGARKRDEVLDAYRRSELFVLACVVGRSGDRDGIPVVLMEALAMKVPSISTRVSGIPELVRHKETGWLVPERDATAIADAIITLANDDQLRAELGRNGRALVEKEFEITGNVGCLVDVFRQVVDASWYQ